MVAAVERSFLCPRCWERISILVDLSVEGEQRFVEDCEVCCHPIQFTVVATGGDLVDFSAEAADD